MNVPFTDVQRVEGRQLAQRHPDLNTDPAGSKPVVSVVALPACRVVQCWTLCGYAVNSRRIVRQPSRGNLSYSHSL